MSFVSRTKSDDNKACSSIKLIRKILKSAKWNLNFAGPWSCLWDHISTSSVFRGVIVTADLIALLLTYNIRKTYLNQKMEFWFLQIQVPFEVIYIHRLSVVGGWDSACTGQLPHSLTDWLFAVLKISFDSFWWPNSSVFLLYFQSNTTLCPYRQQLSDGPGNGLVLLDNKPLVGPMMANI